VARLDDLIRMREVLFLALDGDRLLQRNAKDGEPTSFNEPSAGLVRELRAVTRELDELIGGDAGEVPTVDEIAARREARIAGAGDSAQSARRGQPRRRGGGNRTS
jgi:hypothetical protein